MSLKPFKIYEILTEKIGNLYWWPKDEKYHQKNNSDARFEIMIGAILTQNTSWANVEKALNNLKKEKLLDINKLKDISIKKLQELIIPSGYYNQKAKRLKILVSYLQKNYSSDLDKFFSKDITTLRKELLSLNGIGPETADSIILYAANKPVFVVDAYTKRICQRLPINVKIDYDEIQKYFQDNLSEEYTTEEITKIYNELHAQIVILAKQFCNKRPKCKNCPLKNYCNYQKSNLKAP